MLGLLKCLCTVCISMWKERKRLGKKKASEQSRQTGPNRWKRSKNPFLIKKMRIFCHFFLILNSLGIQQFLTNPNMSFRWRGDVSFFFIIPTRLLTLPICWIDHKVFALSLWNCFAWVMSWQSSCVFCVPRGQAIFYQLSKLWVKQRAASSSEESGLAKL